MEWYILIAGGFLVGSALGFGVAWLAAKRIRLKWRWLVVLATGAIIYFGGMPLTWYFSGWLISLDRANNDAEGPLVFVAIGLISQAILLPAVCGAVIGSNSCFRRKALNR